MPGHNSINIGLLPSIFALKCSLGCLLLTVQSRREKNNGIHFSIVDNAEVHDGSHGCVVLFSHMVGSCQAKSLMARQHGRTDSTRAHAGTVSAKTGYVAKICRQSCVSATCRRHFQLRHTPCPYSTIGADITITYQRHHGLTQFLRYCYFFHNCRCR